MINLSTCQEILPPGQSVIIEQATFTYFPLGNTLENKSKQLKNKEKTRWSFKSFKTSRTQTKIEGISPKDLENN